MDSRFEPVLDPIDEEVARLLEHPDVRARLDAFEERRARGDVGPGIPHQEVRRRFGMDGPAGEPDDRADDPRQCHNRSMASIPEPAPDPVDDDVARILADPVLRARLEDFERRLARGELGPGIPHAEARRLVGLDDDTAATTEE